MFKSNALIHRMVALLIFIFKYIDMGSYVWCYVRNPWMKYCFYHLLMLLSFRHNTTLGLGWRSGGNVLTLEINDKFGYRHAISMEISWKKYIRVDSTSHRMLRWTVCRKEMRIPRNDIVIKYSSLLEITFKEIAIWQLPAKLHIDFTSKHWI